MRGSREILDYDKEEVFNLIIINNEKSSYKRGFLLISEMKKSRTNTNSLIIKCNEQKLTPKEKE